MHRRRSTLPGGFRTAITPICCYDRSTSIYIDYRNSLNIVAMRMYNRHFYTCFHQTHQLFIQFSSNSSSAHAKMRYTNFIVDPFAFCSAFDSSS